MNRSAHRLYQGVLNWNPVSVKKSPPAPVSGADVYGVQLVAHGVFLNIRMYDSVIRWLYSRVVKSWKTPCSILHPKKLINS